LLVTQREVFEQILHPQILRLTIHRGVTPRVNCEAHMIATSFGVLT